MNYKRIIGDFVLTISEDNVATLVDGFDEQSFAKTNKSVQLASEEEAQRLVDEFEDEDGELCLDKDSIMNKYPEFHFAKP